MQPIIIQLHIDIIDHISQISADFYRATLYALHCQSVIVILSVRLSVCHTRALCPHGSTYDHDFFTIW